LVIAYAKSTVSRDNCILIIVNLDAWHQQDAFVTVPLEQFGLTEYEWYQLHDLLTGERYHWQGRHNFIRLSPPDHMAHVFRIRRKLGSERNVDLFQ
jgi:starch synthase (maltosyl-transferring)